MATLPPNFAIFGPMTEWQPPRELMLILTRFAPLAMIRLFRVDRTTWARFGIDAVAQLPALVMAQRDSRGRTWLQLKPPHILADARTKSVVPAMVRISKVRCMALSPCGTMLAMGTTQYSGRLQLIFTHGMTYGRHRPVGGVPMSMRFSPKGEYVAVATPKFLYVYRVSTLNCVRQFIDHNHHLHWYPIAFASETQLFIYNDVNTLSVWDITTGLYAKNYHIPQGMECYAVGKSIIVFGLGTGEIKVLPDDTRFRHSEYAVTEIAINPAETIIAAFSYAAVKLYDRAGVTLACHYLSPSIMTNVIGFNNLGHFILLLHHNAFPVINVMVDGIHRSARFDIDVCDAFIGHGDALYCLHADKEIVTKFTVPTTT